MTILIFQVETKTVNNKAHVGEGSHVVFEVSPCEIHTSFVNAEVGAGMVEVLVCIAVGVGGNILLCRVGADICRIRRRSHSTGSHSLRWCSFQGVSSQPKKLHRFSGHRK